MKTTTQFTILIFLITCIFVVAGCNNADNSSATEDRFLKEKIDTIKKAEEVDKLIQDAAKKQRRMIDENS